MTENTDATEPTQPKRTDDGTTSREMHLVELDVLNLYLRSEADRYDKCYAAQADGMLYRRWAASVRWAIEELK